ncbi:21454_t:CDS:2, partial [Gigaspora rosea]
MPNEIISVPLHLRMYLTPVYLHCSLGRTPNSNPYSEYRSLIGTMNYSRNIRAHALYSGILDAFLEQDNCNNTNLNQDPITDLNLQRAATWLAQNNPYLQLYKKSDLTGFGDITNFFERIKFQNKGAAHTHSCYWTTNNIQAMIANNIIRSTMQDLLYEPELYTVVVANQIHTCDLRCQEPPPTRPRTILLVYMIEENDEYPYYDDTIVKYMSQPTSPEFDNITYPNYFEKYSITPSLPSSTSHPIYRDNLSNYITKHNKEILTRYHFLKIENGELYFYQQLLLNVPERNEYDYKTTPDSTYKEKFLSLFPEFL